MTVHIRQWIFFSCLLYQSLQVICFYRSLRWSNYQFSNTPSSCRMTPTLMHALYAFHTSPHLSSYSFALTLVRCATQSCSGILSGRGPGVKYDSSHALKQESYSTFRGVHSLLRLCDICPRLRKGSRYCFVLVKNLSFENLLLSTYRILEVVVVRTASLPCYYVGL